MVAVASVKGQASKAKMHCVCVMSSGEELYITVRATSEAEASNKVHAGYAVEYVLEVLTPAQLDHRKRRPAW